MVNVCEFVSIRTSHDKRHCTDVICDCIAINVTFCPIAIVADNQAIGGQLKRLFSVWYTNQLTHFIKIA